MRTAIITAASSTTMERPHFPTRSSSFIKRKRFWLDSKPEDMPQRARLNVASMKQALAPYAGRIRRIGDNESLSGISPHLAPGHTPGHTCWLVQSNSQFLLAWGDVIHISYIHLPAPHIAMEYDLDPATAKQSRLRVLDWVARDRIPVAGAHLPSPGIGMIEQNAGVYEFRPDR
jgi:glyoxylase-like metal-dependent hydrolase (beta-lactamase superfamily II)